MPYDSHDFSTSTTQLPSRALERDDAMRLRRVGRLDVVNMGLVVLTIILGAIGVVRALLAG